ncbi:MAG TPA: HAMP domain-containing sensor histidine kinase [Gemmatimonadales bacterium]|nr:HAMP domain-containing sensor histidine kinase [Gemmatimonadales bacterium]
MRRPPRRLRSLRVLLVMDFTFLTSSAVLMVGLTTWLLGDGRPELLWPLAVLWVGSTLIFVCFGMHLVRRLVLRPLAELAAGADRLAAGEAAAVQPACESAELDELHARYRRLAADLLDAQSQLVRSEKLAGLGLLAGGVAHEIRNPLGALATYVEVLRRRGSAPDVVDEMRASIDRIERTVQGLLAYARPAQAAGHEHALVDLGDVVRGALALLEVQGALRGHAVEVAYDDDLPVVAGDANALEQVVLNLVRNACQAAPEARVWIGVQARRFEPEHRAQRRRTETTGGPPPERHMRIRPRRPDVRPHTEGVLIFVADDGPGVPEAVRERVFDPFYTTKDPGTGTGLGLAVAARTVHEAGGMIWVDPAREGGAAFKFFLPAARTEVACAS